MKNLKSSLSLTILLILFIGCTREFTEQAENLRIENGPLVYPGTTHVFDEIDTKEMLESFSITNGEMVMVKNQYTATVDEGHILMLGPSELTPFGALRKVVSVADEGNKYRFSTTQGALNEAIEEGELTARLDLTQEHIYEIQALAGMKLKSASESNINVLEIILDDVDLADGNGPPVILNGLISLDITPEIKIKFQRFKISKVEVIMSTEIIQNISIEVSQDFEVGDEIVIFEAYFNPIVVWGIVLVPKLELIAGYNGEFHTRISASAEKRTLDTYTITYENNVLQGSKTQQIPLKQGSVTITGEGELSVYTGPKLNVLVFGLVGPYAKLTGDVTLSANIHSNPWWILTTGLTGELGLDGHIFGIEDYINPYIFVLDRAELNRASGQLLDLGGIKGKVVDAVLKEPIDNVKVSIGTGSINNMSVINSTFTDNQGNYELSMNPGNNYIIRFEKTGYFTNEYYLPSEIEEGEKLFLEAELQINNTYSGTGGIAGEIVDAFTGLPIEQATLELLPGKNSTSNQPIASTTTNSNGSYIFNSINAGHYTIRIAKDGYIVNKINVIALGGRTYDNQNGTLSPEMSADEWRIVLTWGSSPSDLDSHITGPISESSRFHVYYNNDSYSTDSFNANLDVDDTNSYGPETITLKNISDGFYRYSVHDYSNRSSSSSTALSSSGAKVLIYNGGQIIREFNVPTEAGTLWTVFEINDNMLIEKNIMSYESSSSQIKSAVVKTDEALITNLPEK